MRLRRWMANRRLRTKFVLILMAAMLLVFAITLATMRIPYAAYDQQLYNSSTQLITLFADRIQGELENIEALSFRMLADNVLQESLRDMLDKPTTTSSWMEARTNAGRTDQLLQRMVRQRAGPADQNGQWHFPGAGPGDHLHHGGDYPGAGGAGRGGSRPPRMAGGGRGPCPALSGAGDTGGRMGSPCAPWPRC